MKSISCSVFVTFVTLLIYVTNFFSVHSKPTDIKSLDSEKSSSINSEKTLESKTFRKGSNKTDFNGSVNLSTFLSEYPVDPTSCKCIYTTTNSSCPVSLVNPEIVGMTCLQHQKFCCSNKPNENKWNEGTARVKITFFGSNSTKKVESRMDTKPIVRENEDVTFNHPINNALKSVAPKLCKCMVHRECKSDDIDYSFNYECSSTSVLCCKQLDRWMEEKNQGISNVINNEKNPLRYFKGNVKTILRKNVMKKQVQHNKLDLEGGEKSRRESSVSDKSSQHYEMEERSWQPETFFSWIYDKIKGYYENLKV